MIGLAGICGAPPDLVFAPLLFQHYFLPSRDQSHFSRWLFGHVLISLFLCCVLTFPCHRLVQLRSFWSVHPFPLISTFSAYVSSPFFFHCCHKPKYLNMGSLRPQNAKVLVREFQDQFARRFQSALHGGPPPLADHRDNFVEDKFGPILNVDPRVLVVRSTFCGDCHSSYDFAPGAVFDSESFAWTFFNGYSILGTLSS